MTGGITWKMAKELSELMARHNVTLTPPQAIALAEPSGPMLLSGLASTLDVDCERVQFAPFAFVLPADTPLRFDHQPITAGRIEHLAHSTRGELTLSAYVDHPQAIRCNAFSVGGDVLSYTLHNIDSPNFVARVERIRLREVSLVPNPVQLRARVLKRELPGPMSNFRASTLKNYELSIAAVKLLQKELDVIKELTC